jgi:hypothetical protein
VFALAFPLLDLGPADYQDLSFWVSWVAFLALSLASHGWARWFGQGRWSLAWCWPGHDGAVAIRPELGGHTTSAAASTTRGSSRWSPHGIVGPVGVAHQRVHQLLPGGPIGPLAGRLAGDR